MQRRDACHVCGDDSPERKLDLPYDEPPVSELLAEFYDGRVDLTHLSDGRYAILHCPDCDYYWKEYVLDETGMAALYSEWVPDAAYGSRPPNRYNGRDTEATVEDVSRVKSFFRRHPGDVRVLDFGAGWSHFAQIAQAFGFDTWVYELDEKKLVFADDLGLSVTDSLDGFDDGAFDYVHANHVLEHVPDPAAAVETVSRLLADDGLCYVSVPDASDAGPFTDRLVRERAVAFHPLEHVNGLTRSSLLGLADAHGLQPTRPPQPLLSPSCARKHLHHAFERERVKLAVYRASRALGLRGAASRLLDLFRDATEKYDFGDGSDAATFAEAHFQPRPATARTPLDELRDVARMLFGSTFVTSMYFTKE